MQGAGVLGVTTWVILRSPMKTALLEYLATDRMLGLAVGVVRGQVNPHAALRGL